MFCPKCGKPIPDDSSFCMFCGKSIDNDYQDHTSYCAVCGRELPISNTSGICVTCTSNRSFVPISKNDISKAVKKTKRLHLLPIVIAALLMAILACFVAFYINGNVSSSGSANTSSQSREIASYAQNMVKDKAANPSSVHFDKISLSTKEKDGIWTVEQTFERLAPDGKMAQSAYIAMLRLDTESPNGYKALMLQVDGNILYDYR